MRILSYKFFNLKKNTKKYSKMYDHINFSESYPANLKRYEIFESLLKKYKPKKIIDAGCGAGMPLIKIKKAGFNIKGYDKAKNMVQHAKKNLAQHKLPLDLIQVGNFENPKHLKDNSVDCILGMGAFYYSKKFITTLKNQRKKLKKNGRLIFSLKNKLFNMATLNDYSVKFYSNLYEVNKYNGKIKKKFFKLFDSFSNRKKNRFKNIDDEKVFSNTHNPLSIENEILNKVGLKCNGIYFYHFHSLPPMFEEIDSVNFRKSSLKIEKPNDWRGFLIASGFILDCQKK